MRRMHKRALLKRKLKPHPLSKMPNSSTLSLISASFCLLLLVLSISYRHVSAKKMEATENFDVRPTGEVVHQKIQLVWAPQRVFGD